MRPRLEPAGGWFGGWAADDHGLPCFDYRPRDDRALVLPAGASAPTHPWHVVGSPGLCALAAADGALQLYATARGFVRLATAETRDAGRARFGVGYARWSGSVTRTVRADDDRAVLFIDVEAGPAPVEHEERWLVAPRPLVPGPLMSRRVPPPPGLGARGRSVWRAMFSGSAAARVATDRVRDACARWMRVECEPIPELTALLWVPRRPARPPRPALFDTSLPIVLLAALGDARATLGHGVIRVRLDAHERVRFVLGLVPDRPAARELIEGERAPRDGGHATPRVVLRATGLPSPALEREATWHVAALRSARVPDAVFGHTYVTQGSAYAFVHGVQGAPRDYAFCVVPLAVLDPETAREVLEVMLRMTTPRGAMHYAHAGAGWFTSAGGVHAAPTDLPLFLLWAMTDYVWATGDEAFLEREIQRVPTALQYLRDGVRTGEHGMLRIGSGDWCDPIALMVRDRRALRAHGESGFNSSMAVYVLPRAADLVESRDPQTAAGLRALARELRGAVEASWNGRWYLRGWDGRGAPIGDTHCFLDAQVWPLIAGIGSDAQRRALAATIGALLEDPSPIGATNLDRPHRIRHDMLAPGWDCNGGVWAALNALLAWGYTRIDPQRAWRSLERQSLAAHAAAYPHVWYGIWSGPDAYNAHFGSHPGETFVHPATPMAEFPVCNSNAHAGPLLALLRVLGVETAPPGVVVHEPDRPGRPWRLDAGERRLTGTLDARADAAKE